MASAECEPISQGFGGGAPAGFRGKGATPHEIFFVHFHTKEGPNVNI